MPLKNFPISRLSFVHLLASSFKAVSHELFLLHRWVPTDLPAAHTLILTNETSHRPLPTFEHSRSLKKNVQVLKINFTFQHTVYTYSTHESTHCSHMHGELWVTCGCRRDYKKPAEVKSEQTTWILVVCLFPRRARQLMRSISNTLKCE